MALDHIKTTSIEHSSGLANVLNRMKAFLGVPIGSSSLIVSGCEFLHHFYLRKPEILSSDLGYINVNVVPTLGTAMSLKSFNGPVIVEKSAFLNISAFNFECKAAKTAFDSPPTTSVVFGETHVVDIRDHNSSLIFASNDVRFSTSGGAIVLLDVSSLNLNEPIFVYNNTFVRNGALVGTATLMVMKSARIGGIVNSCGQLFMLDNSFVQNSGCLDATSALHLTCYSKTVAFKSPQKYSPVFHAHK